MAAPHLIMGDVPTLVDAGSPGRGPALEDELRAAGVKVQRIILTHGDPDHVGGSDHLRAVTGAEVCANLTEQPLIDRSGWHMLPRVRRLIMRLLLRGTAPPTVDRWTEGRERLRRGDCSAHARSYSGPCRGALARMAVGRRCPRDRRPFPVRAVALHHGPVDGSAYGRKPAERGAGGRFEQPRACGRWSHPAFEIVR